MKYYNKEKLIFITEAFYTLYKFNIKPIWDLYNHQNFRTQKLWCEECDIQLVQYIELFNATFHVTS